MKETVPPQPRTSPHVTVKIYIYIQYSEFRALSIFQGNRKLLKNPECKQYIQYSEKFSAHSVFQGKRRVAQKSWMIRNIFDAVKNFTGNSAYGSKRKLLKNLEQWKYFQYSVFSVYSLGGDPCNLG